MSAEQRRQQILQQIRQGRQVNVTPGGGEVRPANDPQASGVNVKPHKWGI